MGVVHRYALGAPNNVAGPAGSSPRLRLRLRWSLQDVGRCVLFSIRLDDIAGPGRSFPAVQRPHGR